jgi:hypothetical protein
VFCDYSIPSTATPGRRRPISAIVAATAMALQLVLSGSASANPTVAECKRDHKSCTANCNRYSEGPFKKSCLSRCDSGLKSCMISPDAPGKVDTGPTPPKGTGNQSRPTGGNRSELKPTGSIVVAASEPSVVREPRTAARDRHSGTRNPMESFT